MEVEEHFEDQHPFCTTCGHRKCTVIRRAEEGLVLGRAIMQVKPCLCTGRHARS